MKLVQHLLATKGQDVFSIAPDATVRDALEMMADKEVGALLVMQGDELLGIVTERDYARKVVIKGRASASTPVSEIMSTELKTTTPDASVDSCMALMTEKRCRHLPVLDGDRVVGIVSIGDLVQAIIADQREEIEQLEHYISG